MVFSNWIFLEGLKKYTFRRLERRKSWRILKEGGKRKKKEEIVKFLMAQELSWEILVY